MFLKVIDKGNRPMLLNADRIYCVIQGKDAIDHFFPDQGFFQLEDAVAWMPLPEPYNGKE